MFLLGKEPKKKLVQQSTVAAAAEISIFVVKVSEPLTMVDSAPQQRLPIVFIVLGGTFECYNRSMTVNVPQFLMLTTVFDKVLAELMHLTA